MSGPKDDILTETRIVYDPFINKDVEVSNSLLDRLRGKYAMGPTMANGEPEFGWREFPTPPIQKEAADLIEKMSKALHIIAQSNNVPPHIQTLASIFS